MDREIYSKIENKYWQTKNPKVKVQQTNFEIIAKLTMKIPKIRCGSIKAFE